jgi:hypothetical protein
MSPSDYLIVLLMYVILQGAWTLAVRTFPDVLGKSILRRLDHKYAVKIEETKDELNRKTGKEIEILKAEYGTIKSSTDFLSANQTELRCKMISSTERLWSNLLALQNEFSGPVLLETIARPKELSDAFARGAWPQLLTPHKRYENLDDLSGKIMGLESDDLTKARLFVGDRLWLIHFTIKAVYIRMALLLNRSFKEKLYHNWREDDLIQQHLEAIFGKEHAKQFMNSTEPTIRLVIVELEAKFLQEAMKIMSGSKFFAESISDVQAALMYETARLQVAKELGESV